MIQKKLVVSCLDEYTEKMPQFLEEVSCIDYKELVVGIYYANTPETDIVKLQGLLSENFHDVKTIGMSSGGLLGFYSATNMIILNFLFLKEAHSTGFYREFDRQSTTLVEDLMQYAKELRESIGRIKDVKCVEVYFAWIKASASKFIDELSRGLEEIPFYGAIANANGINNMDELTASNNTDSTVAGDGKVAPGVSVMVYSGPEFYVYCDYLFGWEPVGKPMSVDASDISGEGFTTLYSLDGSRPVDVYDRYLGVKTNDLFVYNICEFPLVVERNGILIGRTPSAYGDEGEVYLEGDILPGEKVRFSYGEYDDILSGTKNGAMRMSAFGAEAVSLVICGNRIIFLQNDRHLELEFYSDGRDEGAMPIFGMGEIYRVNGKGGVLNSALVAVGMREGLNGQTFGKVLPPSVSHHHEGMVPLSERLSHFLKAVTGDLVSAFKDAKAANEAKSAFLSNMSHEIRTPINAVLGMDEMILRESSETNILEYAESIRSAGNSLLGIVNDILDFSKIEAGKMEIVPVEYDMASVLNDLVNMVKTRADDKGLGLVVNVDPQIPHILFGDEIRIKQVVTNILTNAVKYTEKGIITLSVEATAIGEEEAVLHYSVKDTGIGIREEDLPKLFSAFERIDEKRNRSIEGTGLGMSITQNLLNLMGSRLEVRSVYGEGSEFSFDITQKIIEAHPIGNYEDALRRSISSRKEYRESFVAPDAQVLVVDDTRLNLTVIKNLLKKTQVKIDTAESGDECISLIRQKRYDMVFLDHRMPGKDGIETLQEIKKDSAIDSTMPIIALTANAVSGSRDMYLSAGFTDYLSKPIDTSVLEEMMIRFLPKEKVQKTDANENAKSDGGRTDVIPDIILGCRLFEIRKGIKNCGSQESLMDTLEAYFESADDNINKISEYYKSGNIKDYTTKVHALKSSSYIVGLEEIGDAAQELEKAGNEGNISLIHEKTDSLLGMYKEVTEVLREVFGTEEGDEGKELIEDAKLSEAYSAMKELAQMFDYDSILMVLDSISQYRVPDNEKERFEKLKTSVRNADWDSISKALE
ncbi:MAG: response regulator [Butyrivibrio sp.]|nr:response regulator [Butyrivibrio sp.]